MSRAERAGESTAKPAPTSLPKLQVFILLYVQLAEPITAFVIFPFINQMVYEYGITHGDKTTVGYYAGSINTLFFLTEMVFVVLWGRISDKIGRRPVILTGLCGLMLSITLFGISKTFLTLAVSRALSGALNGNIGVMKSMMAELTDGTNQAQAFSYMPLVFSGGISVASFLGGWLSHPYERFPSHFSWSKFWKDYPYALPCFLSALFCVSAFVLAFLCMRETLNSKNPDKGNGNYGTFATNGHGVVNGTSEASTSLLSNPSPVPPPSMREVLTPRVRIAILNNGTFALLSVILTFLQPLILSSPLSLGGLNLDIPTIGLILGLSGIMSGIFQVMFFAPLHQRLGTRTLFMLATACFAVIYSAWPLMNLFAKRAGKTNAAVIVVLVIQHVFVALMGVGYSCAHILITSAAPARNSMGTTTGLSQSLVSLVRAFGPVATSSLFVISMKHSVLGAQFFYVVLILLVLLALVASLHVPKVVTRASEEHDD